MLQLGVIHPHFLESPQVVLIKSADMWHLQLTVGRGLAFLNHMNDMNEQAVTDSVPWTTEIFVFKPQGNITDM